MLISFQCKSIKKSFTCSFFTILLFITLISLLSSCDEANNITPPLTNGEDTTYNLAYDDSILFTSSNGVFGPVVCIGSINGPGKRSICDTLFSSGGSWSPNKRKIIFIGCPVSNQLDNWSIYQYDLNQYKLKRLTNQDDLVRAAAYSPDMKYIAYTVVRLNATGTKVKLYNTVSGSVSDLTDWINNDINSLSWSNNSQNILFDNGQIININTGLISTLFSMNQSYISSPRWSPDGKFIAFAGLVHNGWTNVYIYDLYTDSSRILFPQEAFQFSATWSKDSKQLIFEQKPSGLAQTFLYKINFDGTNVVQITGSSDDYWFPCWYK